MPVPKQVTVTLSASQLISLFKSELNNFRHEARRQSASVPQMYEKLTELWELIGKAIVPEEFIEEETETPEQEEKKNGMDT